MADLDRELAARAAQQLQFVTLRDVEACGGTRTDAHRRVDSGRWVPFAHGVWRLNGVPMTYGARVMGWVLAAGPGAAASHLCAARLLEIGFSKATIEITVPRGRNFRSKQIRVHHSTDLDRCGPFRLVGAIPVTPPARTLLDIGRYIRVQPLLSAVEEARRLELVTWHDVIACLAAHARPGRHGVRRLREAIATGAITDEVTDTDSELMALIVLREHGFVDPVLHHRIYVDGRLIAEIDLAYPELMVAFEIDGDAHLDPVQRARDDERDRLLRRMGWIVERIWWEIPVKQPDRFLGIVRDTLAKRAG